MAIPRRRLTVAGLALGGALALAAGLLLFVQDPERYRPQIETMLGEAAGRPVTIAGPMALSWRPSPTLSARDVQLSIDGVRVAIPLLQVVVEPHALLARALRARRVVVHGLQVDLQAPSSAAVPVPDLRALAAQELELRDVAVLRGGTPWFAFERVTLREPGSAAGARVDFATRVDGHDLRARGRLRTAARQAELDALQVHLPAGVVTGQLRVDLGGQRLQLSGELAADALTLGSRTVGRLAQRSLDLDAFAGMDASVRLRIGRLSLARFRISEIAAPLSWRDGKLDLRAAAVLAGGPLRASLGSGVGAAPRQFRLDLGVTGADAGSVLVMAGLTTAERGGSLALQAHLRAAGSDPAALLASLDGQLAVDAAGLTVRAGAATLAAPDVLASLLRTLQPGASQRVAIGCAAGRFDVHDGVLLAPGAIGLQSRTVNLLGGGHIALGERRVDLVLQPWRRQGLAPGTAGGAGTLLIWGPLADPQAGVSGESAAADAALLHEERARILRALLERARGDAPCAQAASGAAAAPRPAAGAGPSARVPPRRDAAAPMHAALRVMRERGDLPAPRRAHDTMGGPR